MFSFESWIEIEDGDEGKKVEYKMENQVRRKRLDLTQNDKSWL